MRRLRDVADVAIYEEPFPSEDALVEAVGTADVIIAKPVTPVSLRAALARAAAAGG